MTPPDAPTPVSTANMLAMMTKVLPDEHTDLAESMEALGKVCGQRIILMLPLNHTALYDVTHRANHIPLRLCRKAWKNRAAAVMLAAVCAQTCCHNAPSRCWPRRGASRKGSSW